MDDVDDFNVAEAPLFLLEDEERVKEENSERAMVTGAKPMFDEIISWFQEEQAWAQTLDGVDWEASEVDLKAQGLSRAYYATLLEQKIQHLRTLRGDYLNRED